MCCQGKKLPFYTASHPLRPIVFPFTRQKLTVKAESTLTLQSYEILHDILCNTLTSGGTVRVTTFSTVAEMSLKTASSSVHAAAS